MLAARSWLLAAAALVGLLVCPAALAVPRGDDGRIAFERHVGADSEVYSVDWPGSTVTEILLPGMENSRQTDPAWAPGSFDHQPTLAFVSDVSGVAQISVVRTPVGGALTEFAAPFAGSQPAFAPGWPDGAPSHPPENPPPLAFVRDGDVFVSAPDGSEAVNVTNTAAEEANPEWGSGMMLSFDSTRSGKRELWATRIGYGPSGFTAVDPYQVAPDEPLSAEPSWFTYTKLPATLPPQSGDGEGPPQPGDSVPCLDEDPPACTSAHADRVAFTGLDVDGDREIFFASYEEQAFGELPFGDPSRTEIWALTDNGVDDSAPAYSPLGDFIVFQRDTPSGSQLLVMDQDGENEHPLELQNDAGASEADPAWEPVAFNADIAPRRPCGRVSTRPSCRRVKRLAKSACVCPAPEPPPPPPPPPPRCTKTGGPGPDVLRGTPGRDILCGLGGNDTLLGASGDDVLEGGAGKDRIAGNAGDDVLKGGAGNDGLSGGAGHDMLEGGAGDDGLSGGPGRDRLSGGGGKDRIDAHDSAFDQVSGGRGTDRAVVDGQDRVRGVERLRRARRR